MMAKSMEQGESMEQGVLVRVPVAIESAAVLAALAHNMDTQNLLYDKMHAMLDTMRAGSVAAPHMATWMKELVYALPPPGTAIERNLGTLDIADTICPVTGRVLRPWPLQQLLTKMAHFHVDLVGNPLLKALMLAHGMDGPLCLECDGPTEYLGDSMSIERSKKVGTKGGGITMVLCPNGLYSPLTSGVSCCTSSTCSRSRQAFDHVEALARLPPSITYSIPIDADGGVSGQTLLHRDVLRPGVMDMHLGEGPDNVAQAKLTKMGARLVTEAFNAALDLGKAWLNDLKLLVGDNVWYNTPEMEQLRLAPLRAELLVAEDHADKLVMMAPSSKTLAQDVAGLYVLPGRAELVRTSVLNVYESKKEHRRAEAAAVGASIKLSFDFTVQSALNVGEKMLLTVKNENGQTVGKIAGSTSNYKNYESFIREIGERPNVTASLLCLDDVTELENGDYDSATKLLMLWLPSIQECILDRFHVVHRVNEVFNPHNSRFYELMIVKQRDIVTSRDGHLEKIIDSRLRAGTLKKEATFRGDKYVWGEAPMTQEEIEMHKRSGLYHAMLSSTAALVPLIPNPRQHVDDFYPIWQAEVSEAIRQCSMATALHLATVGGAVELIANTTRVHSWPGAAPLATTLEVPLLSLPRKDGCVVLCFIDSKGGSLLSIHLMTNLAGLGEEAVDAEAPLLSCSCRVSSTGGDGSVGKLCINVIWGGLSASKVELIPLKSIDVTDAKGQVLCDWVEFERRTRNGHKRFRLCSIEKLTSIKPYRETTKDHNGEMQHESLVATASNEHTHRRLAEFSGRGRAEDLATGSMVEGDFIDSRSAAIRHDLPGCGADVPHDETQIAALSNKLAGYDSMGHASSSASILLPHRPYDYNHPRAASPSLVVVKQLKGGNAFNYRKPARGGARTEMDGLPGLRLRSSLAARTGTLNASQPVACAGVLLRSHATTIATAAGTAASRKRKATEWTPLPGCACGSAAAHSKHVKKCAIWACSCKPAREGGWGGDHTHHSDCVRHRYAQHVIPYVAPQVGDRVTMIHEARRCGCPDLVRLKGQGWVADPDGRRVTQSAWVMTALG